MLLGKMEMETWTVTKDSFTCCQLISLLAVISPSYYSTDVCHVGSFSAMYTCMNFFFKDILFSLTLLSYNGNCIFYMSGSCEIKRKQFEKENVYCTVKEVLLSVCCFK